jgi:DNA-binding response OmpR family regulator
MSIQARILLVDDESAIIENLASSLERSGFEVKTATNGEEALANIKIEAPELIGSYVLMPKMDGCELLRLRRRDDNWIPVILLTQVGEAFERVMALEEGFDDILTNPSNPTNWLFESGRFCGGQGQENYHSQQPGRLRVAI